MQRDELSKLLVIIFKQWPHAPLDEDLINLFYSCLKEYDIDLVATAAKQWITNSTSNFPPTVGQLHQAIKSERYKAIRETQYVTPRRIEYDRKDIYGPANGEEIRNDEKRKEIVEMTYQLAKQMGFDYRAPTPEEEENHNGG